MKPVYRTIPKPDGLWLVREEGGLAKNIARAFGGELFERRLLVKEAEALDRDARDETLHPAVRKSALVGQARFYRRNDGRRS